jgi:type II secretory pathway component PulM
MSEDTPNIASPEGITKFLEKNGLATLLLLAFLYVAWTSFLSPAADRYMKLLDSVTESNETLSKVIDQLKQGIVNIGESNGKQMQVNQDLLRTIDRRTEEISRKLDDLRGGRGQAYTPPSNFTETDEST